MRELYLYFKDGGLITEWPLGLVSFVQQFKLDKGLHDIMMCFSYRILVRGVFICQDMEWSWL